MAGHTEFKNPTPDLCFEKALSDLQTELLAQHMGGSVCATCVFLHPNATDPESPHSNVRMTNELAARYFSQAGGIPTANQGMGLGTERLTSHTVTTLNLPPSPFCGSS